MNYIEYNIEFNKYLTDDELGVFIYDLGELGFDSFMEEPLAVSAYITTENYSSKIEDISLFLSTTTYPIKSSSVVEVETKNWNELWESNFSPTILNEYCAVRAPFHASIGCEYELVIMPKMSFGTGQHETTRLMMQDIFSLDLDGKVGLDMGCGTGVLGILAAMRGAKHLDIIDIDEWAFDNAKENVEQNGVSDKITVLHGEASLLVDKHYDFILANINRNILLNDMQKYVSVLNFGGTLTISGFLGEDVDMLIDCANSLGLKHIETDSFEKWHKIRFIK